MNGVLIALISWVCGIFFGWTAYRALRTGFMSVGALPAFQFTREERPIFFWWFTMMAIFFTVLCGLNGFGALLDSAV